MKSHAKELPLIFNATTVQYWENEQLMELLPSQHSGEKGKGCGGAEAGGSEDTTRGERPASDSNSEADGYHWRAGATVDQSLLQQHSTAKSAAGATGHSEQSHPCHLCHLSSR